MPELNEPVPLQDIEGLLQQTLTSPLKVQVNDWRHLTDPGENFGSLILAINVNVTRENGKQETHHLVAKMPPKSEYLLGLFNSPMAFKKELYFYTKIDPAFLQLQVHYTFERRILWVFNICKHIRSVDTRKLAEWLNFHGYETRWEVLQVIWCVDCEGVFKRLKDLASTCKMFFKRDVRFLENEPRVHLLE